MSEVVFTCRIDVDEYNIVRIRHPYEYRFMKVGTVSRKQLSDNRASWEAVGTWRWSSNRQRITLLELPGVVRRTSCPAEFTEAYIRHLNKEIVLD